LINTVQHYSTSAFPARILRGFIRRAEYDTTDQMSTSRLYFMYNPSVIARDYVSYLDQGALDPFNTVFQSDNLVAPPSMMNFTFELFFDRQDEAQDPHNPGVLVDMEYFDMVVRNVIPDPALQSMPDNGVMMVNPRDISVIFSPEITVQGRPLNASLVYEKFTHRMVPTRMRIQLTMRVVYWGPMRDMTTYTSPAAEETSSSSVNFAQSTTATYSFTLADLEGKASGDKVQEIIDTQLGFYNLNSTGGGGGGGGGGNSSALNYAVSHSATTKYDANKRMDLWNYADCSSLVWGGFQGVGQATALGWSTTDAPSTAGMYTGSVNSTAFTKIWGYDGTTSDKTEGCKKMAVGDLLIRFKGTNVALGTNHVAFVSKITDTGIQTYAAQGANAHPNCGYADHSFPLGSDFKFTHGVRPMSMGNQGAALQNNDRTNL
jgi:hypothetical protein